MTDETKDTVAETEVDQDSSHAGGKTIQHVVIYNYSTYKSYVYHLSL